MTITNGQSQTADLFSALVSVRDASGTVSPRWTPDGDTAYAYVANGRRIDESALESLAQSDHLDRVFVERISRCPSCQSHLLNMREVCAGCKSPRVYPVELLHHYRCGYVAPAYEFELERDGRRCPKCHGVLRDRGTDHDVPGPHFACQSCNRSFQVPELGAVCLSCGSVLSGTDLEKILFEDVWAYRVSLLGAAALRAGSLHVADNERLTEYDLPILRRSVFMQYLEDERRRSKRFHTRFALLLLTVSPPADDFVVVDEAALLAAVVEQLAETDKIGRYDERHYLALLPSLDTRSAEKLAKRLASSTVAALRLWNLTAQMIDLPEGAPLGESLHASLLRATVDA
jgi:hypothetical protein